MFLDSVLFSVLLAQATTAAAAVLRELLEAGNVDLQNEVAAQVRGREQE